MLGLDRLEPLVLAIVADDSGRGAEILPVDVQAALVVEICPEMARVAALPFLTERNRSFLSAALPPRRHPRISAFNSRRCCASATASCRYLRSQEVVPNPLDRFVLPLLRRPVHELLDAADIVEVDLLRQHGVEPVEPWAEDRLALVTGDAYRPLDQDVDQLLAPLHDSPVVVAFDPLAVPSCPDGQHAYLEEAIPRTLRRIRVDRERQGGHRRVVRCHPAIDVVARSREVDRGSRSSEAHLDRDLVAVRVLIRQVVEE